VNALDTVERFGSATIQHGPASNRVYLMCAGAEEPEDLVARVEALAADRGYTKIFTKLPPLAAAVFAARGYVEEARIPGYYRRREDAVFMSRFPDPARARDPEEARLRDLLSRAASAPPPAEPPDEYTFALAEESAADDMAALYREVFASYPFPIHDSAYLRATLRTHVRYLLVRFGGRLVAVASGELDADARASEMTDFATHPDHRGRGLASALLRRLDRALAREGIRTGYTIARAPSSGMNRVFASGGYRYAGTLVRNTQICGRIESMNVWHKALPLDTDAL
jgi:beta-lysine N6-acetyltransferase